MFSSPKPVIAMVHAGALPGTPASRGTMRELVDQALAECRVYREAGVHWIILGTMHDVPYLRGGVGPEITAATTVLALAVRESSGLPLRRADPGGCEPRANPAARTKSRPAAWATASAFDSPDPLPP